MALKHGEVNPLAVANMRQLDFLPPHFEVVTIPKVSYLKKLSDWIYENLDGRFYINDKNSGNTTLGFENHSEASYFAIMLPEILKDENDLAFK